MPRVVDGVPVDHSLTARKVALMGFLEIHLPRVSDFLINTMVKKLQDAAFDMRPEWRLSPAPPIKHAVPVVSDNLVAHLAAGDVTSVGGVSRVTGPRTLELDDGTTLEVDAVIWCTGYKTDYNLLDRAVDPTRHASPRWEAAPGSRGKPLPRLYRNVFSLDHPRSLAFMGGVAFATGAFPLYDLCSMALAQTWRGASPLPSRAEMEAEADAQHDRVCGVAEEGSAVPQWVRQGEWVAWADETAGARVGEHLGWGVEGWRFWWEERRLYGMLSDGVYTPFIWRLFDGRGKRRRWEGAREAIERVNAQVKNKSD